MLPSTHPTTPDVVVVAVAVVPATMAAAHTPMVTVTTTAVPVWQQQQWLEPLSVRLHRLPGKLQAAHSRPRRPTRQVDTRRALAPCPRLLRSPVHLPGHLLVLSLPLPLLRPRTAWLQPSAALALTGSDPSDRRRRLRLKRCSDTCRRSLRRAQQLQQLQQPARRDRRRRTQPQHRLVAPRRTAQQRPRCRRAPLVERVAVDPEAGRPTATTTAAAPLAAAQ